jgi:glycosyltransferase involved in cell wall biosynthesis
MHILYLHQHFAIPSGSTGTRSYEFSKRWVKAGHQVTMICGHYDIGGLQYSKGPQYIEGIKVLVVGTKYSNKMSFFKRVLSFFSFIFFAFSNGLKQKDIDIIYATSTPLTIGIPAILLKWFKRIPFIFEVRDQWPRIPIEMNIIKNKIIIKILQCLEKFLYEQSAGIVALSPGMADGIKSIIGNDRKVVVVPNSSDLDTFSPANDGSKIRKEHGWENKFILIHFGAIGKANGLEFLIEAARKLRNEREIHFVIIGDGSEKERLINIAAKLKLENIEFIGSISKDVLKNYVAAADVSLVIFANYPILEHNSANKFFDSLAAGKPILLNYSGWQRELLEKNNAGFGIDIHNLEQFSANILKLYKSKEILNVMGKNARRLAEDQFGRNLLSEKVLKLLEATVNG